jgi:hypothetical protein
MPLLSPNQIHQVLKNEALDSPKTKSELESLLRNNNLSKEEVLENLALLMRSGETDGVRLRAAETALKLNGLLTGDDEKSNFSVTIIINDSQFVGVNPILIPRTT